MTGILRSDLPVFLLIAGSFHFVQVAATCVFFHPLKPLMVGQVEGSQEREISDSVRFGLVMFILGSGLLVMVNAPGIAQGGLLAASLCLLLALVFSFRLYVQLFRFTKFLRAGASRPAHGVLLAGIGFTCLVYAYSAIILFAQ